MKVYSIVKNIILGLGLFFVFLTVGCQPTSQEIERFSDKEHKPKFLTSASQSTIQPPEVIPVFPDSLKQYPLSYIDSPLELKAKKENPLQSRGLIKTKGNLKGLDSYPRVTPGSKKTPSAKSYSLPSTGFIVVERDTIWAPIKKAVLEPELNPAGDMRNKQQARLDIKYLNGEMGLTSPFIPSILEDEDGVIWFGGRDGLVKYDGNYFSRYDTDNGLIGLSVSNLTADKQGNLLFLAENELTFFDGLNFTYIGENQGIQEISNIHLDSNGVLWVGTSNNGVFRIVRTSEEIFELTHYTVNEGLTSNTILQIESDDSGLVWIATSAGITVIDEGQFFQIKDPQGIAYEIRGLTINNKGNITYYDKETIVTLDGEQYETVKRESEGDSRLIYKIACLANWSYGCGYFWTRG